MNVGDLFSKGVYMLHRGDELYVALALVQEAQDKIILNTTSQSQIDDLEEDACIAQGLLSGYKQWFIDGGRKNIIDIKEIIPEYPVTYKVEIDGITIEYKMRLDGRIVTHTGKDWVLEIKTRSGAKDDMVKTLPTDLQINSYWLGLEQTNKCSGVLYRFCVKPTIKVKQKETAEQYRRRIIKEYLDNPVKYFYEDNLYFDAPVLNDFKVNLHYHFRDLLWHYANNIWPKRGTGCIRNHMKCSMLNYCSNPTEETLNTFYVKGEPYE